LGRELGGRWKEGDREDLLRFEGKNYSLGGVIGGEVWSVVKDWGGGGGKWVRGIKRVQERVRSLYWGLRIKTKKGGLIGKRTVGVTSDFMT